MCIWTFLPSHLFWDNRLGLRSLSMLYWVLWADVLLSYGHNWPIKLLTREARRLAVWVDGSNIRLVANADEEIGILFSSGSGNAKSSSSFGNGKGFIVFRDILSLGSGQWLDHLGAVWIRSNGVLTSILSFFEHIQLGAKRRALRCPITNSRSVERLLQASSGGRDDVITPSMYRFFGDGCPNASPEIMSYPIENQPPWSSDLPWDFFQLHGTKESASDASKRDAMSLSCKSQIFSKRVRARGMEPVID